MKLNTTNSKRRGIAMTEYLVILAIVAVGAILATGLFGQQIRSVFASANNALTGQVHGPDTDTASAAVDDAADRRTMGTFTDSAD
jgi:type IV pilus assembly protein PilA